MNEINIVMDRSGSMETNSKENICLNIIQSINALMVVDCRFNSLKINKLKFGNSKEDFEQLKLQIEGIPTIILTDGYYFFDFFKGELNTFLEKNINNLYFIICGCDGIDLSNEKFFPKINSCYPHNIVEIIEKLNENFN